MTNELVLVANTVDVRDRRLDTLTAALILANWAVRTRVTLP